MDAMTARFEKVEKITEVIAAFLKFYGEDGFYTQNLRDPLACDFAFGNPQEMPLPGIPAAIKKAAEPKNKDWFAYKQSEPDARQAVAASLQRLYDIPFDAEHIHMTNGAFGALAAVLAAVVNPGDEVIFISPPWFFYEPMILDVGGTPVRVKIDPQSFDLDLAAIHDAITSRTRAIIINSPNNPTGKIYPPETLQALSSILDEASARNLRPIYLLSDESYSRILFDGRTFHTPAAYYANSFLIYTYGKTLLIPGERIGYVALPPDMPERDTVSQALWATQIFSGWLFPNAILQYSLPDLEKLSIDVGRLQQKRDRMAAALRNIGYKLHVPEGTFYLLVKSPIADDQRFCERLAQHKILCMPGAIVEMPGYFRISLTASEDMIERSLAVFKQVFEEENL